MEFFSTFTSHRKYDLKPPVLGGEGEEGRGRRVCLTAVLAEAAGRNHRQQRLFCTKGVTRKY